MKYRRFGKTGLMLPVVTCGCMRFQHSWKPDDPVPLESQKNVEACVCRAFELGINHFETARGYGTTEVQLGRILPRLPRDQIIVQTKVNPEADVTKFVANFDDSMRRLDVDYLDIFSIHGINNGETFDNAMRCLETVRKWKEQGRIRHIGFASHGPTDIQTRAIRTEAFESVNLHWFYIFQDNRPAIAEAAKRDMGVYIISPNDKGGQLYKPSAKLERLTAPLHPMVFNDLFCLACPDVHSISCGVSRPGDFDIHMQAVQQVDRAAEVIAPIRQRLEEEMVRVFGKEWVETWRIGLPKWNEAPGGINIPVILFLRNLVLAFDMVEYGKMRYNLLGNGGHWFPGNNAAKLDEYDLAECLKNSPHASQIPAALKEAHHLLAGQEVKRLQRDG
jgi:hypothetical protein